MQGISKVRMQSRHHAGRGCDPSDSRDDTERKLASHLGQRPSVWRRPTPHVIKPRTLGARLPDTGIEFGQG
nr:MAG: hypothetical protein H3RhizoLitter14816_000002 [Mitovirus sp.]